MAGKHDWNTLGNYLHVVWRAVEDDPFVISHNLATERAPEAGEVSGALFCHGDIVLDVTKYFEIRAVGNRVEARTTYYAYHAHHKDGEDILRYDNAHQLLGHDTPHHKHEFDSRGETVTHVGAEWPHLSEVLDELKMMSWG